MSYELIEVSQDDGRPVELFEFRYSVNVWRHTSADRPIVHAGNTYTPLAGLTRDAFDEASDATRATMNIQTPKGNDVAELFRVQPPSEVVTVTVYGKHYGDVDDDFAVIWKGRILNCEWVEPYAFLTSENVFSSLLRPGQTAKFSRNCRVPLYSGPCGVIASSYRQEIEVDSVSGVTVLSTDLMSFADNYFAGGYITWIDPAKGNTMKLMVTASDQSSGSVTLINAPVSMVAGLTVELFPGCDHTPGTCSGKFGNIVNFRGEPLIPSKSPFNGTTLF